MQILWKFDLVKTSLIIIAVGVSIPNAHNDGYLNDEHGERYTYESVLADT